MEIINILTFLVVATLLVVSPGPNGVLIAKTVSTFGRQAGFLNVLGFVAAFYIHGTLSVFGISILLVQSAQIFFIFKMAGAAYLIWIGIRALSSAWQSERGIKADSAVVSVTSPRIAAFYEGFLTNMLNPKVSMFYLAAFPQFLTVGEGALSAYLLVSLHAIVNLVWFTLMVCLLARLKSFVGSERLSKCLKTLTGVVFISFGAKLATLKPLGNG